jgi:GNAT superfamily N-acetyltransferase
MRLERDDTTMRWDDVAGLFVLVGWSERSADELRHAFGRSSFKVFAYEADELVGVARTVDDGRYYATIVDVLVKPSHQGRGIGRALVLDLQTRLSGFLQVTLTAAAEVRPFYEQLGWRRQTSALLLPRSQEQASLNCEPTSTSNRATGG